MSSSVYFRFKSQREPSRVVFDGTGISVFELKKEIITLSHLGDGTDFELVISSDETNEGKFRKFSLNIGTLELILT
jgi:protein MPE1